MLAFTTKSINKLIIGPFLVFELEVEFDQKFLSPRLYRSQLRLAEEVTDITQLSNFTQMMIPINIASKPLDNGPMQAFSFSEMVYLISALLSLWLL